MAERLSYDAHGKRRQTDWQPAGTLIVPLETPRGFTGHEHLDKLGLIHMNGRVYDPVLGRFLSADPIVQFPTNTQSFNRYSYVLNNPLSFTDPSGFGIIGAIKKVMRKFTKFLHKYGRVLMSVAAVATCGTGNPGCAVLVAAVTSGMWTASYGGSLTDVVTQAAISAGTALAFNKIGDFFGGLPATTAKGLQAVRFAAKTFAHGVVGGVSTALRGGKLGAGFLAGAFANLASTVIGNMPGGPIAQTVASAVAGGAGAKLGGGKFANGAITGAFSYLFNHAMHYASGDPKYHHYTYKTPICRASVECTKEIVFDGLRRYPAPGHDSRTLVEDGDVTAIAPAGVVGDAWHAVDPANYTVSNITLPNHMFHSGIVVRSVVQENGIVYVQTHGEGTGNWGGFNEAIGSAAMAKLDQDIRIYLHRKTYMARDRFPGY